MNCIPWRRFVGSDQVGGVPDLQRLMAFGSYGVPGTWNTPGDAKRIPGFPGDESWVGKPDFSSIVIWNLLMPLYSEILFPKDVADRWVWSDWEVGVAILLRQSWGLLACSLPSGNCLVASFQTLMRFSVWCKQPYSWRVFWIAVSNLRQHSLSGFQMVLVGFTPPINIVTYLQGEA